jgi:hypothetical protein
VILLLLKKRISENERYVVELAEKVVYNDWNINDYKEIFETLKKGEYIKAHSFSDIIWYFVCPVRHKNITFSFDVGNFPEFNSPLKSFALLRRMSGRNPSTILEDIKRLKDIIISTDGLRDANGIKMYFMIPSTYLLYRKCKTLSTFLEFYPMPEIAMVVNECMEYLRKPSEKNRKLPMFDDVMVFDECVMDFFYSYPFEETLKYYPVFLWWTITNIIPMRPIELLNVKINCLHIKDDASLWITIPRFKYNSSSMDETYWEQSIQIDKLTYDIIKEYTTRFQMHNIDSKYLVPSMETINSRFNRKYTVNEKVSSTSQLKNLISFFYEEIIEGHYHEKWLEKINAGDTRHFAIINMFLQGFNILSICRLAGQEEITTPSNYYSHAKHFATSFVYKLAQRKLEGEIGATMSDGFIGSRRYKVERARSGLFNDTDNINRRVDFGYCKDENFPNNCVEDCRICERFYEFNPSLDEWQNGVRWFQNYSNELQEKIDDSINLMGIMSKAVYEDLKDLPANSETELKSTAIQLFKYLDQKAIIDARLMEGSYE